MVVGLPKVLPSNVFCKGYVLGKHHRAPFDSRKAWCAKEPQNLVHSDICRINKLAGARYVLAFIDDLSRFTWVYFLNNKNHVFEKLKEFRALAEKQCGQPIKC